MDKLLKRINEMVEGLRVVDYNEERIDADTNFIGLKRGSYLLGNGNSIVREGIVKRSGSGNAVCIFAVTTDIPSR